MIPLLLALGWAAVVVVIGRTHRGIARPRRPRARPGPWPRRTRCRHPFAGSRPLVASVLAGWVLVGPVGFVTAMVLTVLLRRARSARAARCGRRSAGGPATRRHRPPRRGRFGRVSPHGKVCGWWRSEVRRPLRPAFVDVTARVDDGRAARRGLAPPRRLRRRAGPIDGPGRSSRPSGTAYRSAPCSPTSPTTPAVSAATRWRPPCAGSRFG